MSDTENRANGFGGQARKGSEDPQFSGWVEEERAKQNGKGNGHGNGHGRPAYRFDDAAAFLAARFPPAEPMLGSLVVKPSLAMVYSWRGIGKTWFAMSATCAVAAGRKFLRWEVPHARRVLYVDGEMPPADLQKRFRQIEPGWEANVRIFCRYAQAAGTSFNLNDAPARRAVEDQLHDRDLLVLDNRSMLFRGGKENESGSWDVAEEWLLSLRGHGISVLLLDHTGRSGENARGTSKREDALDTVVQLKRPADYQKDEGCRFEVHWQKARHVFGDECAEFEAQMEVRDGVADWSMDDVQGRQTDTAVEMYERGSSVAAIAEYLGLDLRTVQRRLTSAGVELRRGRPKSGRDDNVVRPDPEFWRSDWE